MVVARLLAGHRERLDALVHALLERETRAEPEAYAAAGLSSEAPSPAGSGAPPEPSVNGRR